MNIEGLIPLFGGLYGFLLANGTLPKHPKDPEKMAARRGHATSVIENGGE